MKKQGDLYLKIVSIVLAGIVVAYLVLSVLFGSGGSSYTLETAVRCEAGDGQTVSGFECVRRRSSRPHSPLWSAP